jgi:hypothetical protein
MASIYSIIKRETIFRREVLIFNYFGYYFTQSDIVFPSQEILNEYEINRTQWNKTYIKAFKFSKYSDKFSVSPTSREFELGEYEKYRKDFNTSQLDELIKNKLIAEGLIIKEEELNSLISKDLDAQFCQYCGISIPEIRKVIDTINTRRIITRGRTLEIEKRDSHQGYTKSNILLVCYWCNNAKSDEYSEGEFEPIANAIAQVWKKRGAVINHSKTVYAKSLSDHSLNES